MAKIDFVLKEVLRKVNPSQGDLTEIEMHLKNLEKKLKDSIRDIRINAKIIVGGSYAKGTLIKKGKYDIDIFLRFEKEYSSKDISVLTKKILKNAGLKFEIKHGSRNYFRIEVNKNLFFELIPVLKVNKPEEAENITDLSYLHVNYINKKVKLKRIKDDIKIAKAFCYANNCYGAESYINGFSGYGLELLVYNYNGFLMFLREMANVRRKKIIDIEFHHKNPKRTLMDLNASKLHSPVILIDPTYKYRNVLAALSEETFRKFQKEAKRFLKNPSMKFFEKKRIDFEKKRKEAKRKNLEFRTLKIKTKKQKGDIAGSKLLKFYNHLLREISEYFFIKENGFEYNNDDTATCFFSVKRKKEVLVQGPKIDRENEKHAKRFKKAHKNAYVKNKRLFAKKKLPKSLKDFLTKWEEKNKKKMGEMGIVGISIE